MPRQFRHLERSDVTLARAAWDAQASDQLPGDTPQRQPHLEWSQYPGHGPGIDILGPLQGKKVIELGCGNGDNLAAIAHEGAHCTGIDCSRAQLQRATTRWPDSNIQWEHTDAIAYLKHTRQRYDLAVSIFGAVGLSPPEQLLTLLKHRIKPAGRLVFSLPSPTWLADKSHHLEIRNQTYPIARWNYPKATWVLLLDSLGWHTTSVRPVKFRRRQCCTIFTAIPKLK